MSAPDLPQSPNTQRGHLPKLPGEWYRGNAAVFWTHTVAHRREGWLDVVFHSAFREIMLHAAVREHLLCPIYTLMPDHLHVIWMGVNAASDQRRAAAFLRGQLGPRLAPAGWQHQPHDHVLRADERKRGVCARTCSYIAENPVRAGLVAEAAAWGFSGCVVPGYPMLHPLAEDFWGKFWRIYAAAVERESIGTIGDDMGFDDRAKARV